MNDPLSAEDLINLTGRIIPSAQVRELDHLGIPYARRRDGFVLVLRAAVEKALTGVVADATVQSSEPNFAALLRRR